MHDRDPCFGYAWYCQPAVVVTFATARRIDRPFAEWVHDFIDDVLAAEADEVAEQGGVALVHDWRRLESYDPEARRYFFARMRQRAPGYSRGTALVAPPIPLLRLGIRGVSLVSSLTGSGEVKLVADGEEGLRRYGVVHPVEGLPFERRTVR